ncbi:hypothetical protein Tco_1479379 [Tanacetum coccineum]
MAAIVDCFKQVWASIVGAFTGCCGGKTDDAPTTDIVEKTDDALTTDTVETDTEVKMSIGGGGKPNENTASGTSGQTLDMLATSMMTSGGGGKSN